MITFLFPRICFALLLVALFPAPASSAALDADAQFATLPAAVDRIADHWISQKGVVGMSIAVARDDALLIAKPYGKAHLELEVATPDRAVYEVASEAKTFTGVAILKLVERGQLKLDDTLAQHLPGVMPDDVARRVTIRQLLTHSAGVFEYTAIPEYAALAPQALPRDELVKLIAARPLTFEPGTAQSYSNSGYLLLGLVVEKLSGKPWGKFIEQEILPLAGMADSRASWNADVVPRMATGYEVDESNVVRRAPHHEPEWIHGNGGIRSTARDMVKWMQALHGGKVIGAEAYRQMITPGKLTDGTPLRYGLGVVVDQPLRGHRVLRHGGTFPGYTNFTAYLPEQKLVVAVLVNSTRPFLDEDVIVSEIVTHLLGDATPRPVTGKHVVADYLGEYRGNVLRSKRALTVGQDADGKLTAAILEWGEEPRALDYLGGDRFTNGWTDYEFARKDGEVVSVRRVSSDTNITFERPRAGTQQDDP